MRRLPGIPLGALFGPTRVGWLHAAVEGLVGALILIVLIMIGDPQYQPGASNGASVLIGLLSSIWLVCWPAWRMRTTTGRPWWRRWRRAFGRMMLCGLTVGLLATIFDALWPPVARLGQGDSRVWALNAIQILFLFLCARLFVAVGVSLRRLARRRLLWQLTASHFAVIVLTFVAMMAVGSAIAASLFLAGIHPAPQEMAVSAANALRLAGAASDESKAQTVVAAIESGQIPLHGASPLAIVAPTSFVPIRTLVLSPDGTIRAAAINHAQARAIRLDSATAPLPGRVAARLRTAALAGHSASAAVNVNVWFNNQVRPLAAQTVYSAAPILDARGRPAGVAMLQVALIGSLFTPSQFLASTLAIFGVLAFIVLLVTALPLLGLSTVFGYLLARNLTRRLEAVSRVTTAIAAGDLTQRAPVRSSNEVGQLAEDVNRMADHLETAMGELRRARTQAEDALKARQELVASISHELRTPLAIVRAHLDTLALRPASAGISGPLNGELTVPEATLHALQNETERLAALVDDLFTLSRAETGALQVYCRPVDVAALADDVATLMRPLAQSEGMIALSVEAPPGLPPALADGDRLRQILENLVRNAVRHTPDGGIIVISVARQDSWIVVSVADTGEGIPAEHLSHIFERFYRVDQARARTSGGAGLGLALVREFVELMGGHVSVESTVGEGSCFHVYLPLATSAAATTLPLAGTA